MQKIKLTKGYWAIVDNKDYKYLSQWKWYYSNGYAVREIGRNKLQPKRVIIRMHRLINKTPKGKETDHKNLNTLDNRRCNLRSCSRANNTYNRLKRNQKTTSKYKGVSLFKQTNKWRAYLNKKGKQIHLGFFKTEIAAAKAYDKAVKRYFKQFAKTNF